MLCLAIFIAMILIPIKGHSTELVPPKIRVGLFHNSSARGSYRLNSEIGFKLGLKVKEELFTVMDFSDRLLECRFKKFCVQ